MQFQKYFKPLAILLTCLFSCSPIFSEGTYISSYGDLTDIDDFPTPRDKVIPIDVKYFIDPDATIACTDLNIDEFAQKNQILAFVDESLSEGEAREIGRRLEAIDNVKEAVFVSRETAMENFIEERTRDNDNDFFVLTPSVFRNRYVIYLNDLSMLDITDKAIENVNGIADTNASSELSAWFIAFRNVVTLVSVILIVILFVVSVFIMQNTIKLATFSRREEIGIMKMVGASNSFIRCPFVVEGLILGLLGGVIAFFALWGIYQMASEKVLSGMIGSMLVVPAFHTMQYPILIIYLAIGLIVGTFGSNIAIRNYLKV